MTRQQREARAAALQERRHRLSALDPVTVTLVITPHEWAKAQRKFAPELYDAIRDAIDRAERARRLLQGRAAINTKEQA